MSAKDEIEVFELTAEEQALQDEDIVWEYSKRFPLARMNSRDRQKMIDAIVEEEGLKGGWFWWYCLPGCMPTMSPNGPFETYAAALADAEEDAETYYPDEGDEDEDCEDE